MTNEERDLITRFIQRVGGAPASTGGSVPATTPALPPIDREADALIADLFTRYPEARYRLTQTAFVQEHALVEAQNQINQLQWQVQQLRQAAPQSGAPSPWGAAGQQSAQPAQPQPAQQGMFGRLFGGSSPPPQPQPQYQQPQQPQYAPPPPQYPPNYQPGMFQRQGSGFLGSALTTAAGVAGGMVAGNALMNLFSGGHGGGGFGAGGFGAGGFGSPSAVEYVPVEPVGGPWAGGPSADPFDAGGAPKDPAGWADNTTGGWQDANQGGGWQDPNQGSGGWQDVSSDNTADSGWTDSGSSDDLTNT